MEPITLLASTRNQQIDDILRGAIGILETTFPNRIKAYYLHGSFFDDTAIPTSDIDLFLVTHGKLSTEERTKMQHIMHFSALFSPFMVEMLALDDTSLLQNGHYRIKSASKLLRGTDIRSNMPEQTLEQYLRTYASFPFIYSATMLRTMESIVLPLSYPQPEGEFYGYDQQLLPPKNEQRHNIKKLVTGVCWTATVLIAWQAGQTVSGKRASVELYREYVHDEWTDLVTEMYEMGNRQWHYLVPFEQDKRRHLHNLCTRVVAFENHYLHHYQTYLQAEVQQGGERMLAAMPRLKAISPLSL
jgi:hypothetical protein